MHKNVVLALAIPFILFTSAFATSGQVSEDPIYIFANVLTELVQIFLSMWRIAYVIFEVLALLFIFLGIPVIIFKLIKWGFREVFKEGK